MDHSAKEQSVRMLLAYDERWRLFGDNDDDIILLYIDGAVLSVADPAHCDIMLTQETYAENLVTIQRQPTIFNFILDRMLPETKAVWNHLLEKNIIKTQA